MAWYSTRFATTSGIIEIAKGEVVGIGSKRYLQHGKHGFEEIGRDVFESKDEAIVNLKKRLEKAITSSEKKTVKLKKMLAGLN